MYLFIAQSESSSPPTASTSQSNLLSTQAGFGGARPKTTYSGAAPVTSATEGMYVTAWYLVYQLRKFIVSQFSGAVTYM